MFLKAGVWLNEKWLFVFTIVALGFGIVLDLSFGSAIDYWVHDSAVVFQARAAWRHSAVVVLDDNVPIDVGRKQALPLFARATERLLQAGAKGVFLDARLSKEMEGMMPYAECIRNDGSVQWSQPNCHVTGDEQCIVTNSTLGSAPLKMKPEVFSHFKIAPYLPGQEDLPDFLLYDWDAEDFIPAQGLVVNDVLTVKNTPIARWLDLSSDHAALALAKFIDVGLTEHSVSFFENEICDGGVACRRIRLSRPIYKTQLSGDKLVLPVSALASCDEDRGYEVAIKAKNKAVVLQMTNPTEATDVIITPMTTALFGPHMLTPGAQYLVDAVETLLTQDQPREPPAFIKYLIFMFVAGVTVWLGAYYPRSYIWCAGTSVGIVLIGLCFFVQEVQLWPVTTTLLVFLCAAGQTLAAHLLIGFREGHLISQYMPRQIHELLITLGEHESFRNRRHQAIVLMSDLACYTRVTDMLKEPGNVLRLMNDYLSETSFVLQDKYQGWLESYIGDMVCYYWPYNPSTEAVAYQNALQGALELSLLQKRFFNSVGERYRNRFDETALNEICKIINAGIGLSSGTVIMGDMGPKNGVRKFGILGRPMNLTSRIESLTRLFNTEIIITSEFLGAAETLQYPVRRLGCFCVKGCNIPTMLYAVGFQSDIRFRKKEIEGWSDWLVQLEQGRHDEKKCPGVYLQDKATLLHWWDRGLLDGQGIWHLDEK
ncbi:MAG: adenylate/guanylate cyclase domain-containing protein [Gammaproteobacteria bacterium]